MMTTQHIFKDTTGGFLGLGNFNKYRSNPFGFLLSLVEEQGDIAFFRLGPLADIYLVTNPEFIREILVKHWEKTVKWSRMADAIGSIAPDNIVILEGDIWRTHRKLLTPAFHTQRIKQYMDLMVKHTVKLMDSWEDQQVYDMSQMMTRVTMGIIGEILFDIPDIERDAAQLRDALEVLLAQFVIDAGSLVVLPKWLPMERHKREQAARDSLTTYLESLIQHRRKEGVDHGDVLSSLVFTKDADTGEALTDAQVRDELYSLFVAGHETTALWVMWTLYVLAKHPEFQLELYREVVEVIDDIPTLDTLGDLKFMDRVLKESLRMYPPAWSLFFRTTLEDISLGDKTIPEGGVIYISPYVQHHLPQYWQHPDLFDPSRFEGDWKANIPTYAYIPFSGGARVCLGAHMADMEAKVILATLIRHFSVEQAEPDMEVYMNAVFTLKAYPNMPLRVRKR